MKATITEVGPHALSGKESMIILFGESATDALREYSVIQKFDHSEKLTINQGDQLKIGENTYHIEYVGPFANSNLASISHVTLIFSEVPKNDPIANGLYLSPYVLPDIKIGTKIDYLSNGLE